MEHGGLIEYIVSRGHSLAKQTATEWAGACPFCGGSDRFRVLSSGGRGETGHYFCRQCGKSGDLISWKIEVEGQTYKEAVGEEVRRRLSNDKPSSCQVKRGHGLGYAKHSESETNETCFAGVSVLEGWSEQAERVLSSAWQEMKTQGAAAFFRDSRGLSGATCKALKFGWNEADSFFPAEQWGQTAGKKIAVPAGAVLPIHRGGRLVSLLVRRAVPFTPKGTDRALWFHEVRGAGCSLPFLCGPVGAPLVVCESILCAATVYQVTGGKVAALATLGASKGGGRLSLDDEALAMLNAAPLVVAVLDNDEAGEKLLPKMRELRPDIYAYTVPTGKDGAGILKENGKPAKDINDILQVWRDDSRVFGWLASGFMAAQSASSPPAEPTPAEPVAAENPEGGGLLSELSGKGDKRAMPEPSSVGSSSSEDEAGPDEFAAHVEQVRGAWPDGPPMIAQDMPDWRAFCAGYPDVCGQCPYYDANPNSSPCALWEAAFPSVVRWYPPTW